MIILCQVDPSLSKCVICRFFVPEKQLLGASATARFLNGQKVHNPQRQKSSHNTI